MLLDAEAAAGRTGAIGIVEGEQPRLDFRNRETGNRAGELFREQNPFRPALVVDFCDLLRRRLVLRGLLYLLPPPLWGRVGEGGTPGHRRLRLTPLAALRRTRDFISAFFFKTAAGGRLLLPHKGGGDNRRGDSRCIR